MDNLTHSLYGLAFGLAIERIPLVKKLGIRNAILAASVIGNNLPDIDFVGRIFHEDPQLSYLLQHRGYTHTLLASLPFAALVFGLVFLFSGGWKKGRALWSRKQSLTIFAVSWASLLLHLAADFCNDYGLHPFSPFFNRWYYGGILFIVEPLIWAGCLPLLIWDLQTRLSRVLGVVLILVLFGLVFGIGAISVPMGVLVVAVTAISLGVGAWRKSSLIPAWVTILSVIVAFTIGSRMARQVTSQEIASRHPHENLLDVVTTPAPANPFCWRTITIGLEKGELIERIAGVSLWPARFEPIFCFFRMNTEQTAPLLPVEPASGDPRLVWRGEFRGEVGIYESLRDADCRLDAYAHWVRAPFWVPSSTGGYIVGDLRYDTEKGLGFSEFVFDEEDGGKCLDSVPNWEPPLRYPISSLTPSEEW